MIPAMKPAPVSQFEQERADSIATYKKDDEWQALSNAWLLRASERKYHYNFTALGRPIIQLPQDMVAVQEAIWETRPDLIIETGIAHGGSLILSAAALALLDYCDAVEKGEVLDPKKPKRRVLGIDIDIRAHNRAAIEAHPMSHRIDMIQGSSIDAATIAQVKSIAANYKRVMVCLDSNHTHDHVLAELEAYAPLTTKGCHCLVFDTAVEDLPDNMFGDRPWKKGDNPKTAVRAYLEILKSQGRKAADGAALKFETDHMLEDKLLLTVAPEGFLKRV
jgi:cephalosporin hydroxylase